MSQVKAFSAFPHVRKCKSLGSLQASLRCAPHLSGAAILCFPVLNALGPPRSPSAGAAASVTPLVCCRGGFSQPWPQSSCTVCFPGAGPCSHYIPCPRVASPLPGCPLGHGIRPSCSYLWPAPHLAPISRTRTSPRWLWAFSFSQTFLPWPGDQSCTVPLGPGTSLGTVFGILPSSLSLCSNLPITDIRTFIHLGWQFAF